jgi:hypothetical protein
MTMHRLIALALVPLLLVSCGGTEEIDPSEQVPRAMIPAEEDTEAAPEAQTVAELLFIAVDIAYEDPPTEAPSGLLGITIENQGNLPHDVVFEGENNEEPVVHADGGETDQGTIELQPGDYVFYCSIPGHRAAGMEGTLTVQ